MIIPTGFRKKIIESVENNKGVIFKNFFDSETIPGWEEIMQCLHNEISLDTHRQEFSIKPSEEEKTYGNVIMSDKLYLASHLDQKIFNGYFPKVSKALDVIRNSSGIVIVGIGPRVCLGPHIVKFHKDQWHAFALQCEGKAKWILSDTKEGTGQYVEEFYPEKGDMIFFPKGMWHRIETQDAPRAGLQFNALIS
jgi:hypothetical protein